MKKLKIVGTNTLLMMAKNLLNRGEINQTQYLKMEKRNNNLPNHTRKDIDITKR